MNKNAETTPPELETVELNLPVKAEYGVYDTSSDYGKKMVNYGSKIEESSYTPLTNGTYICFPSKKLTNSMRIDERNLVDCWHLNLKESSVISLCTTYLTSLRVLCLMRTKINILLT